MVSSHLNWLIIRDHNSFLLKQKNIRKPFSKEPNNLTNLSSYRYSGLVHKKTLAVAPADKKSVTLTYNRAKHNRTPAKSVVKATIKAHDPRHALKKVARMIDGMRYRRDLKQAALRRTSAIIRSQRTYKPRKGKAGTAPAAPAAATPAATAAPKKAE
ncbi:large ribosomal subunit protein eL28 [Anopheles ziemanni]|uniref:large ribosomal subunit protein eL28 n=1 Tax=Anopheles coustani TaxID=139045 RepID=UPI002659F5C4|nr:large ribosomal subunit protein eL28 [Anopheles coustani]XP_058126674.1 large ribosomal subunit protein eL28 [Anopheles coustani]XP_058178122.1 large ribosomal subunit protein eL28 [Anopheles ziemanni]